MVVCASVERCCYVFLSSWCENTKKKKKKKQGEKKKYKKKKICAGETKRGRKEVDVESSTRTSNCILAGRPSYTHSGRLSMDSYGLCVERYPITLEGMVAHMTDLSGGVPTTPPTSLGPTL